MAKMSDFSNHNIFAYMLASCANLNFHPVPLTRVEPHLRQTNDSEIVAFLTFFNGTLLFGDSFNLVLLRKFSIVCCFSFDVWISVEGY